MKVLTSNQVPNPGKRALKISIAYMALSACFIGLLDGGRASAQTAAQVAQIVKSYSEHSQAVVERLGALNRLSAEEWRFHAGDLAHGESPDLDDSSWPLVKPRMEAPQDAVWFRRWIEVPATLHGYDLTGARIWFSFQADANGPMPEIIYFNGRRVALGDDLEPIVLFDQAKPGDKVLVAVKLLHTVDKKTFAGTRSEDRFRRKPTESRGSKAGNPVGGVVDPWFFQGCCRGHGNSGEGHWRGRSGGAGREGSGEI